MCVCIFVFFLFFSDAPWSNDYYIYICWTNTYGVRQSHVKIKQTHTAPALFDCRLRRLRRGARPQHVTNISNEMGSSQRPARCHDAQRGIRNINMCTTTLCTDDMPTTRRYVRPVDVLCVFWALNVSLLFGRPEKHIIYHILSRVRV